MKPLGTIALALLLAWPAVAGAEQRHPTGGGASSGSAAPRSAPAPSLSPAPAPHAVRDPGHGQDRPAVRGDGQTNRSSTNDTSSVGRHQGDLGKTGNAVARTSPANPPVAGHGGRGPGGAVIVGAYPWVVYGGYYGGYYGGTYGADPWPGGPPPDDPPAAGDDQGALRLKVKPVEASVYVDGDYVGIVDQFNGVFQRLPLVSGPHLIELRAPDYETLSFDVLIQPGQSVTYHGEMTRQP